MCFEICMLMKMASFEAIWEGNIMTSICYWATQLHPPPLNLLNFHFEMQKKPAHLCQIATKCQTFLKQSHDHKENHAEAKPFKQVSQSNKMQSLKLFNQSISDFQHLLSEPKEYWQGVFQLPALISLTVYTSPWGFNMLVQFDNILKHFFLISNNFLEVNSHPSLTCLPSVLLAHYLPLPLSQFLTPKYCFLSHLPVWPIHSVHSK